jgi:hypothetical protein
MVVLILTACAMDMKAAPSNTSPEATLISTAMPLPIISGFASSSPTLTPTATVGSRPTSTPWPTVDPTLYATLYVTPTFTFTPTPNYYAQMKDLYRLMIGEWWGKMGAKVNRQGRKAQYVVVTFEPVCEMGQICGRYHFDDGCFGELVLDNWRPTFLVFRNLEYSTKESCRQWIPMNVRPLKNDQLSFTFGYRLEEKRINMGVVLVRK